METRVGLVTYHCHRTVPGTEFPIICLWGEVHINLDNGPYSSGDALHLMCHEIGHAVALDHATDASVTCMDSGAWSEQHLRQGHDWDIINNRY